MIELYKKVKDQPYICKIALDHSAFEIPLSGSEVFQNFYDTKLQSSSLKEFYNSKGQARFSEQSSLTRSGVIYNQSLIISFPDGDLNKSRRLALLNKVKFIAIGLTNGRFILLGRNDAYQNTRPKIKSNSNEKKTIFTFSCVSMISSGYLNLTTVGAFPYILPSNT